MVDEGGVQGEDAFHAHAVRDLAHGEGGVGGAALDADHVALEHLNTLFFAFHNAQMHFHRVAGAKHGHIHTHVFTFNFLNDIHALLLKYAALGRLSS